MSHNIMYFTYSAKTSERAIEKEVVDYVHSHGDRYGTEKVKFIDFKVFENEDKARDYIENELKNDWYQGYAVKFYDYSKVKSTKKIEEFEEKIRETFVKKNEFISSHSIKNFKAAYIGCSNCGSKLSKKHLSSNICPVCKKDLRAESTLERIAGFDKRIEQYTAKIQQEKSKLKDKAEVKWLVKFEYHS